jgi:hypothetical protein
MTEYTLALRTSGEYVPQLHCFLSADDDSIAIDRAGILVRQCARVIPTLMKAYLYRDHYLVKSFTVYAETHVDIERGTL